LCFGWIDSINKGFDEEHTIQRFTPRKLNSTFSQANKERLRWLAENNLIHQSISETINEIIEEEFVFPADIINEIKKDETAWKNYNNLFLPYRRIRIAFIDSARNRPDEFTRRLSNFIRKTHDNKLIPGFGGIEKYY